MKLRLVLLTMFLCVCAFALEAYAQDETAYYHIKPDDVLKITVYNQPDLAVTARVNNNGHVTFPLLGNVPIVGLTVSEAEDKLRTLLEKDYLVDPQVQIFISEYHIEQITVLGAVKTPGKYKIDPTKTTSLLEGIAMAFGFTPNANIAKTRVMRQLDGKEQVIIVDVKDITKLGMKEKDIPIFGKDVIFVEELPLKQLTVLGAVKTPGKYDMYVDRDTTFLEGIAMANGFLDTANMDSTKVIRVADGERQIIPVNVRGIIQEGKKELDIPLKIGDIIFVEPLSMKQLTVLGSVKKPGKYDLFKDRDTTILDAIGMAEGLSDVADIDSTKIIRVTNGERQTIPVDLRGIIEEGKKELDMPLKTGDTVFVDPMSLKQLTILGSVKKPGKYDLYKDRDTTILDVIGMAEGFTDVADINGTRIIRKSDTDSTVIKVHISNITKKGMVEDNVSLKAGDVIFVPESLF